MCYEIFFFPARWVCSEKFWFRSVSSVPFYLARFSPNPFHSRQFERTLLSKRPKNFGKSSIWIIYFA